ncbi:unnamed protein product [Protopolystoma xenopodis]|uniref:Uncharacterized protein n=1 Tax=Protopolystoma xenopodis TaxID=117903 RepID=A0A3S5B6X0_9PLAT|nr:unnamed protein product [Protopolystoma xenopodis]
MTKPKLAENSKMAQDLVVDRLQRKVDQLKDDLLLYEAQLSAQTADFQAAQEALHEAEAEILTIRADRKQLMAQWNSSLIGLQRRNEAYAALLSAYK